MTNIYKSHIEDLVIENNNLLQELYIMQGKYPIDTSRKTII